MPRLKTVITALLIGIVLLFTLQNLATIELRFLIWELRLPRWLLFFGLLLIGVVVGWIWSAEAHRRRP